MEIGLAPIFAWPMPEVTVYDFHLSFGEGSYNGAQGAVELPEEFVWLWRDYDSGKDSPDV